MADATMQTWDEQVCVSCNNNTFQAVIKLRAKVGGGFTTMPAGYVCQKCGEVADVARMQREALRKQRMQELRALEQELVEETIPEPEPVPVLDSGSNTLPTWQNLSA